jgi:glycosyltransferase involved in cell wall biosynthesis
MHVLLIHQAFAALDEPGGTRHHEFAQYLASQGDQVTIIASPISYLTGKNESENSSFPVNTTAGDITLVRAYTYPALHRSFVHRMFSFISFMVSSLIIGLGIKNVDLVWGTSPPIFQSVTAWVLSRIKRVPFLLEVRDLWPAFAIAVGILQQPLLIRASLWLERFLYRQADLVVVNSPGFIEHIQARGSSRVELVANGSDASMFEPDARGETFRKNNRLGDKFVALYAGAHGMSNDLGVVLEAAHLLRARNDISLVLLGDGKDKSDLINQAQEMALPNVKFIPPVPKNEMASALAAADACVAILKPIPLYATVYPNKVFDYMAAGRPVILAIAGVIQEVVETAQAGIVVPPGDPTKLASAISTLADQPQLGIEMGKRGHSFIKKHFDRKTQAEKFSQLMKKLVEHQ